MDFFVDEIGEDEQRLKNQLLDENDVLYSTDKKDKVELILDLFDKKKKELDAVVLSEEEIVNKLKDVKIENMFDEFFEDMKWMHPFVTIKHKRKKFHFEQLDTETGKLKSKLCEVDIDNEMKNAVLQPGKPLPRLLSHRKLKAIRKQEREKTKGPEWYNMPAPEITEELKNDLQVLKMRSAMDPKHFYKKNDMEVLPKYFQVGRIMDSPLDHTNERLTRKQRKRTLVDELLADADFQKYNKKKYKEIVDDKRKKEYRTFMKDKRQRNKAEYKKNKMNIKKQINKKNKL